jgi:hypothetical protein
MNSGNQLELFMYNTFGANTQQVSEGTVQTGITASVGTTTATIGESNLLGSPSKNLTISVNVRKADNTEERLRE